MRSRRGFRLARLFWQWATMAVAISLVVSLTDGIEAVSASMTTEPRVVTVAPDAVAALAAARASGGGDDRLVQTRSMGRAVSLLWPWRLPKPTLAGDVATYADVLPGVDLAVRALANGSRTCWW